MSARPPAPGLCLALRRLRPWEGVGGVQTPFLGPSPTLKSGPRDRGPKPTSQGLAGGGGVRALESYMTQKGRRR